MRLIDADELIYFTLGDVQFVPAYIVEDAEEVEAIPIKFLEDRISFNEAWNCIGYAQSLQSAIDEWEENREEWLKKNADS